MRPGAYLRPIGKQHIPRGLEAFFLRGRITVGELNRLAADLTGLGTEASAAWATKANANRSSTTETIRHILDGGGSAGQQTETGQSGEQGSSGVCVTYHWVLI